MKQISKTTILEFKYDSEEERADHLKEMEGEGFLCDGEVRKTDDPIHKEIKEYYWYGRYVKYE